jgi:hypothetical protein
MRSVEQIVGDAAPHTAATGAQTRVGQSCQRQVRRRRRGARGDARAGPDGAKIRIALTDGERALQTLVDQKLGEVLGRVKAASGTRPESRMAIALHNRSP